MIYIDRCYSLSFENRHLSSLVSLDRCFETVKKIMNTHRPSLSPSLHKYIKWCGVFVYVAQRSSKCEKGKKRLNQLSISNGAVNRATERNLCTHVTHSSKEDETWKRRATKKDCRNEEEETLADMCHTYFPPSASVYLFLMKNDPKLPSIWHWRHIFWRHFNTLIHILLPTDKTIFGMVCCVCVISFCAWLKSIERFNFGVFFLGWKSHWFVKSQSLQMICPLLTQSTDRLLTDSMWQNTMLNEIEKVTHSFICVKSVETIRRVRKHNHTRNIFSSKSKRCQNGAFEKKSMLKKKGSII